MHRFQVERRIRFSDCDPAGIVFYPQYFVMLNGVLEAWIDGLGIGFADLISRRRVGLPTVRLDADFRSVSRFGDQVAMALQVERIGTRSIDLAWTCTDACTTAATGELRMSVRQRVVTTSLDTHRAIDIPPDLRAAIAAPGRAA